jgi:hypothetical protein
VISWKKSRNYHNPKEVGKNQSKLVGAVPCTGIGVSKLNRRGNWHLKWLHRRGNQVEWRKKAIKSCFIKCVSCCIKNCIRCVAQKLLLFRLDVGKSPLHYLTMHLDPMDTIALPQHHWNAKYGEAKVTAPRKILGIPPGFFPMSTYCYCIIIGIQIMGATTPPRYLEFLLLHLSFHIALSRFCAPTLHRISKIIILFYSSPTFSCKTQR